MSADIKELAAAAPGTAANAMLGHLTALKIAATAKFLVSVRDTFELKRAVEILKSGGEKYFVLGGGSNILFARPFYDGAAIVLEGDFRKISRDGDRVSAGAGARLAALEAFAVKEGLSGLEPLSGIPGTVGGALAGNSGAGGAAIADNLETVSILDENRETKTLDAKNLKFAYRTSPLAGSIILGAVFRLKPDKSSEILKRINSFMSVRTQKHPRLPSAGSVFKNPEGKPPAGKLIDDCGLKGRRAGGAMISDEHANFIVNAGGATADDFLSLMELAAAEVRDKFGVRLEPEIKVIW